MIRLEDIKPGLPLTGLDPAVIGSVVAVVPIAEGTIQLWDLRLIRQQLASMNLDWGMPPYPEPAKAQISK